MSPLYFEHDPGFLPCSFLYFILQSRDRKTKNRYQGSWAANMCRRQQPFLLTISEAFFIVAYFSGSNSIKINDH